MNAATRLIALADSLRSGADPVAVADRLEALALDGGTYAERVQRRNEAIRAAVAEHRLTSVEFATRLSSYRGNGWRRDRLHDRCPPRYKGKLEEQLFTILHAVDRPLSDRQIRNIIRGNPSPSNFRDGAQ